jgi:Bardet-Biedl syndrome 9 protein
MSVFQLNEWWGVQVASNEEFDFGCLCVGNVDNSVPSADKIVVGSLEGMIRIYSPSNPQYRIEDLILEESLEAPILQLLVGRFIPSTENCGLAVLHPRKLVVYEVSPKGQKEGRANYHVLHKAYEHVLGVEGKHFTAYNMTSGSFGGARGRCNIVNICHYEDIKAVI